LKLEEFITSVKDTTFENINRALDAELFSLLEEKIREKLQLFTDIAITVIDDNLSAMKKSDLYSSILSKYQELNFSDTDSEDIYVLKVSLKEKLYTLAPDSEKQVWLDSLISDFG
jgi:hypothetical protein